MNWYHTMKLGDEVTDGIFDWRSYWDKFKFGELEGKSILDVGTADGFFSFQFEKLGAIVTALDIPPQVAMDDSLLGAWVHDKDKGAVQIAMLKSKFLYAAGILKSKVTRIEVDIYKINRKEFGSYDIVFCNDLLLHLSDPVRALARMREVCNGTLIVGTPIYNPLLNHKPVALYIGHKKTGGAFWKPNPACFVGWLYASGFQYAELVSKFKMLPIHSKVSIGWRGIAHGKVRNEDGGSTKHTHGGF